MRNKRGREESPSVGVIDSQSVKVTKISGECRGIDGGKKIKGRFGRLKTIYADGGYRGELINKVKNMLNCEMEITLRTDKATDFKPLPKRWVVERSFVWLDDFRRLSKDYERTVVCSENMIYLAFISLMLKWL